MDHASASFTSPWAVLSGHAITSTNEHSFGHHHGLPMDLQYPYYRPEKLFDPRSNWDQKIQTGIKKIKLGSKKFSGLGFLVKKI
ncbi:hypothetical protein PVAND_009287 [Polypedilum vanderplanki]|uniref:Uncharacterized protein n=1 Tax=Polypedilum vanderplanki TaxID=319348 RepID=A0A9J6CCN6_POLVA|nr:hypothetical protein PVAND_009287 [Polypedilum vanderplanki]